MLFSASFFSKLKHTIAALLLISSPILPAQESAFSEYQLKAVFLYNFTQFITWPTNAFQEAQSPFVIGILGDDPFHNYLNETVANETVNGHQLVIHHYKKIEDIETTCQILFINLNNEDQVTKALESLKERSILTVSDAGNFIQNGGMIHFITRNNKIRLQINPDAIKKSDLTVSSKLLRVAEIVTPKAN